MSKKRIAKKSSPATGFGLLPGALKDKQSVTADWQLLQPILDGVHIKEIRHVPKENGHLTEIWRRGWALDTGPVEQVLSGHAQARRHFRLAHAPKNG